MITALALALALQSSPAELADVATRAQQAARPPSAYTPEQDIQWAATVAATRRRLGLPMRADLTEAQQDTCAQIYDRMGAWAFQRSGLSDTQREAIGYRDEMTEIDESEWKQASAALLDLLDAQLHDVIKQGDRAAYALMSASLVFCSPE